MPEANPAHIYTVLPITVDKLPKSKTDPACNPPIHMQSNTLPNALPKEEAVLPIPPVITPVIAPIPNCPNPTQQLLSEQPKTFLLPL